MKMLVFWNPAAYKSLRFFDRLKLIGVSFMVGGMSGQPNSREANWVGDVERSGTSGDKLAKDGDDFEKVLKGKAGEAEGHGDHAGAEKLNNEASVVENATKSLTDGSYSQQETENAWKAVSNLNSSKLGGTDASDPAAGAAGLSAVGAANSAAGNTSAAADNTGTAADNTGAAVGAASAAAGAAGVGTAMSGLSSGGKKPDDVGQVEPNGSARGINLSNVDGTNETSSLPLMNRTPDTTAQDASNLPALATKDATSPGSAMGTGAGGPTFQSDVANINAAAKDIESLHKGMSAQSTQSEVDSDKTQIGNLASQIKTWSSDIATHEGGANAVIPVPTADKTGTGAAAGTVGSTFNSDMSDIDQKLSNMTQASTEEGLSGNIGLKTQIANLASGIGMAADDISAHE